MSQSKQTEAERRKQSKEAYEAVVSCISYNSGGAQPPLARQPSIVAMTCRGGYAPDDVHRAIVAACANGDLFRWSDGDTTWLGIDDVEALRDRVADEAKKENPDGTLIGVANERTMQLRGVRE